MAQPSDDRRRPFSLAEQLHLVIPLLGVWAVALMILSGVAARGNPGQLLLDPTYASGAAWYTGFVSSLGVLAWGVAAAAAGWCGWTCRIAGRASAAAFMRGACYVSCALLFDDLFDFHAGLLPKIGIPKLGGEAILAAIVAHWVIRNWHEIRRTRVQLLTAAIFACSASIVIDFLVNPSGSDRSLVFEDGAKFLGILAWATFFVVTTRDISRSVLRQVADDGVPDPTLVQSPRIDPATRHRPSTGSVGRPLSIG